MAAGKKISVLWMLHHVVCSKFDNISAFFALMMKRLCTFTRLLGTVPQKTVIFILCIVLLVSLENVVKGIVRFYLHLFLTCSQAIALFLCVLAAVGA
jgi:hypothetical protein